MRSKCRILLSTRRLSMWLCLVAFVVACWCVSRFIRSTSLAARLIPPQPAPAATQSNEPTVRGEQHRAAAVAESSCPSYWRSMEDTCCRGHRSFALDYNVGSSVEEEEDGDEDCVPLRYDPERDLPVTALASFPGSGNTWARHLIEQTTGVFTGSISQDHELLDTFPGERHQDGRVLLVKTHDDLLDPGTFRRAVLLLRNPFDAMVAEFERHRRRNDSATAKRSHFKSKKWDRFVRKYTRIWLQFHKSWLRQHSCIYVLMYEDLQADLIGELQKLASVLGLSTPLHQSHISCLKRTDERSIKRNQPSWMVPARKLFTQKQQRTITAAVDDINELLEDYDVQITLAI